LPPMRVEALAVGMGGGPWGREWAFRALEARLPTVLDADALHLEVAEAYRQAGIPAVLTPHAGEAGRLLGVPPEEVAKDPLEAARTLAEKTGLAVVLKGNPTVVAQGTRLSLNPTGNPALATGGTGDVLAGAIAALLAAGLPPFDAARLGVFLHGLAGDLLAEEKGVGLLAREVAEALPRARRALASGQGTPPFLMDGT
ncbi:NAD(P)H-hydrate dehydratase, partial [Thermus scotoductus]